MSNHYPGFRIYKSAHAFPLSPYLLSTQSSDFYNPASFTMIYIAAFILTLFLTHIVCAVPLTCGKLDDPHGLSCGNGTAQYTISNSTPLQPLLYKVTTFFFFVFFFFFFFFHFLFFFSTYLLYNI